MNAEKIIAAHNRFRRETLNLQASENYLSERVRNALASDMASRYSMVFDSRVHGAYVHNAYGGAKFQEEITEYASSLASKVFGFKYVNVKPISGHIAAMTVLLTLTKKGDKIMAIAPEKGGYDGYSQPYMPDMFGLEYHELNVSEHREIDVSGIEKVRPALIILGASYILFPYNLKEVLDAAEDVGAGVVYDASHVMGLLPSGFQEHIHRCDVVYGSTHKSYPGPQGGIMMSNSEEFAKKLDENLTWKVQDNFHTHRVAAMAVSLEEFAPVSEEYGKKVAENSRALAEELHRQGIVPMYPPEYTQSHQVLLSSQSLHDKFGLSPARFSEILEKNGIIVDRVGRIGTAELTWKGYATEDMKEIAALLRRAIDGENIKDDVHKLVSKWDGKTIGMR